MRMIDLFSGLGGASDPFRDRGWDVVRVDADSRFEPDIVADIEGWSWSSGDVDLLWASPPCDEFAREWMPWSKTGATPSLRLVHAVHRLVGEVRPRWWVLENVRGAQPWIGRSAMEIGPVHLWGWFPRFSAPLAPKGWKERLSSTNKTERAKIPYEIGWALAEAIEDASGQPFMPLFHGATP